MQTLVMVKILHATSITLMRLLLQVARRFCADTRPETFVR